MARGQQISAPTSKSFLYGALLGTGVFLYSYFQRMHAQRVAVARSVFDITDATTPAIRQQLTALLDEHAHLAGQALVLGKDPWQVLWSPDRTAFIPFLEGRFSLLSWRDPVGPKAEHAALNRHFIEYARMCHKQAVMLCVTDDALPTQADNDHEVIWVGSEMFYDLARYSMRGKANFNLRHAINNARNHGTTVREIFPLQIEEDRHALCRVESAWKAAELARNTNSFLRTAPLENAEERRYFGVEVPDGTKRRMCGFIVCSQVSARGWCLQDLIREPEAPRGCLETGVAQVMETFKAEGLSFISMSMVPFYDPTAQRSLTSYAPLAQWAINYFDRSYHFTGLARFRAKFMPTSSKAIYVLLAPRQVTPMLLVDVLTWFSPFRRAP
jgi:phosphatidylglycerol lysyltransferase